MDQSPAPRPKKSRRYTADPQTVSDSVVLGVFEMPHGAGRPSQEPAAAPATTSSTASKTPATGPAPVKPATPSKQPDPVLEQRAAEDDPRRWGDSENDLGEWMKSQRPPHWD